jgi:hypothetical protein
MDVQYLANVSGKFQIGTAQRQFESIAACFRKPVARRPKILVPGFREVGHDLFRCLSGDFHARMDNISPGVHSRAFSCVFFETDPLCQDHSERVVDPPHFVRWLTIRYDVTHNRLHRLANFDFQPASRFPRPSFAPVQLAINVCKFIPSPPIRENFPGELPAGLGVHTILKSKHNLAVSRSHLSVNFGDPNEVSFGAYYLYTVALTL